MAHIETGFVRFDEQIQHARIGEFRHRKRGHLREIQLHNEAEETPVCGSRPLQGVGQIWSATEARLPDLTVPSVSKVEIHTSPGSGSNHVRMFAKLELDDFLVQKLSQFAG
jgi:hypothetical protein